MAPPALPSAVVRLLASEQTRTHHVRWHYVRDSWTTLSAVQQAFYTRLGWNPPRLRSESGAGLDFLWMHRHMIEHVNRMLADPTIADPLYSQVVGWNPIPWNHTDGEWPMPPAYPATARYDASNPLMKDQRVTTFFEQEVTNKYENPAWLATVALDAFGTEIENNIHAWMHMHWSALPWFIGASGQDQLDPQHDYLGDPFSSQVNLVFWKLHGWIDDRIVQWETVNNQQADFSNSWEGPPGTHPVETAPLFFAAPEMLSTANLVPLTEAEARYARTAFTRIPETLPDDLKYMPAPTP